MSEYYLTTQAIIFVANRRIVSLITRIIMVKHNIYFVRNFLFFILLIYLFIFLLTIDIKFDYFVRYFFTKIYLIE